jgi:hypothetical protein
MLVTVETVSQIALFTDHANALASLAWMLLMYFLAAFRAESWHESVSHKIPSFTNCNITSNPNRKIVLMSIMVLFFRIDKTRLFE